MHFSPKTVNNGLVFHYDTGNTGDVTGRTYNIINGGVRDFLIGAVRNTDNTTILNAANFQIPLVKAYNRALTASEVQRNFNAIRSRFGI